MGKTHIEIIGIKSKNLPHWHVCTVPTPAVPEGNAPPDLPRSPETVDNTKRQDCLTKRYIRDIRVIHVDRVMFN